jgi:hypothetical protein
VTVTVYGTPGTEAKRSTRFQVYVNGVATYTYGVARTVESTLPEYWTANDNIQQSFVTFATTETATVRVDLLSGPITSYRVYPAWKEFETTLTGGDLYIELPPGEKAWVSVNDEHGEPVHIRGMEPPPTAEELAETLVFDLVEYDGSQTEASSGEVLVFTQDYCEDNGGTVTIGQAFPVEAGAVVYIEGGAWVIGSLAGDGAHDWKVYGHGVLSGEFATSEAVRLISDFDTKITYAMIHTAGMPGYVAANGVYISGITIVNSPFYCIHMANAVEDVMVLSPWRANTDGMWLAADSEVGYSEATNCYVWNGDDTLGITEGFGAHRNTDSLVATSAGATLMIGYWPGIEYFPARSELRRITIVAMQTYRAPPIFNEGGAIFQAWSDGEDYEEHHKIHNYLFDEIYVEHETAILAPVFHITNTAYPWGAEADQRGQIYDLEFRHVRIESVPDELSRLWGYDRKNTPHHIGFFDMWIAGVLVTVRNYTEYFQDFGVFPYNIHFGGRNVTTAVDICNTALSAIGERARVTAIDPPDGSAEAAACTREYALAVAELLELHNWNFVTKKEELTVVNEDPDDTDDPAWLYRYVIPDGMSRAISVLQDDVGDDYVVAGVVSPQNFHIKLSVEDEEQRIYTNVEDAWLRFTVYTQDPNQFSVLFNTALTWLLASKLAGAIVGGDQGFAQSQRCLQQFSIYLAEARTKDSRERKVTPESVPAWMKARGITSMG